MKCIFQKIKMCTHFFLILYGNNELNVYHIIYFDTSFKDYHAYCSA